MSLDGEVRTLFDALAAAGRPALSAGTPEAARAVVASGRAALGTGPALRVEEIALETRSGIRPARLYRPEGAIAGMVVYFHGGGWVVGTLDDFDAFARTLAARSGCAVLSVDYRLAPETPYPGAVEDCVDALRWAAREAPRLVGPGTPLVVAGDSAGGNLAAVASAALRGEVALVLQLLIYPVTDHDLDTGSYRDPANAYPGMLSRDDMAWFFDHYVPAGRRNEPDVAPLRRADLAGLPPAFVVTAEYDVLRDEGEAYAARLRDAGVPTRLRRMSGLPHAFIRLHNLVRAADAAVTEMADAVAAACAAGRDSGAREAAE